MPHPEPERREHTMKRVELERWLRSHGVEPVPGRGRGRHEAWQHQQTGAKSFVPRHREIGVGVARAICRQLGVPPIPHADRAYAQLAICSPKEVRDATSRAGMHSSGA